MLFILLLTENAKFHVEVNEKKDTIFSSPRPRTPYSLPIDPLLGSVDLRLRTLRESFKVLFKITAIHDQKLDSQAWPTNPRNFSSSHKQRLIETWAVTLYPRDIQVVSGYRNLERSSPAPMSSLFKEHLQRGFLT